MRTGCLNSASGVAPSMHIVKPCLLPKLQGILGSNVSLASCLGPHLWSEPFLEKPSICSMFSTGQIQRKLESTLASQKSAQEAAQRYLTAGKKLCVGGDKFAEAKIAFEQGLAEKPSDPELVRSLTAALAQFSSTSDDSVEGDEEKEENNPVEELARANRSRLES